MNTWFPDPPRVSCGQHIDKQVENALTQGPCIHVFCLVWNGIFILQWCNREQIQGSVSMFSVHRWCYSSRRDDRVCIYRLLLPVQPSLPTRQIEDTDIWGRQIFEECNRLQQGIFSAVTEFFCYCCSWIFLGLSHSCLNHVSYITHAFFFIFFSFSSTNDWAKEPEAFYSCFVLNTLNWLAFRPWSFLSRSEPYLSLF